MTEKSILQEIRTEWFTPEQVAEWLDVDVTTVYRWLNGGLLSGVQLGKKWRITENDIRSFIAEERKRQERKVLYRRNLREAKAELKRRRASQPEKNCEIVECLTCGMPFAAESLENDLPTFCSQSCANSFSYR
jgi:excisionase family DNA binding protein